MPYVVRCGTVLKFGAPASIFTLPCRYQSAHGWPIYLGNVVSPILRLPGYLLNRLVRNFLSERFRRCFLSKRSLCELLDVEYSSGKRSSSVLRRLRYSSWVQVPILQISWRSADCLALRTCLSSCHRRESRRTLSSRTVEHISSMSQLPYAIP